MSEDGKGKGLKSALTGLLARVFRPGSGSNPPEPSTIRTGRPEDVNVPSTPEQQPAVQPRVIDAATVIQSPANIKLSEPADTEDDDVQNALNSTSLEAGKTGLAASIRWDALEDVEKAETELEDETREGAIAAAGEYAEDRSVSEDSGFADIDEETAKEYLPDSIAKELADFDIDDSTDDTLLELPSEDAEEPNFTDPENEFDLPDFNADARQNIWQVDDDEDEAATRGPRAKAAALAPYMNLVTLAELPVAMALLIQLFETFRGASTYGAFKRLIIAGLDLSTLEAVIAVRSIWADTPDWWYRRDYRGIHSIQNGKGMLTWALAYRICIARPDYPPDMMIDPVWFDEWLQLTNAPGVPQTFTEYIDYRLANMDDQLRRDAECDFPPNADRSFVSDSVYWYRSKSGEAEGIMGPEYAILSGDPERPGKLS